MKIGRCPYSLLWLAPDHRDGWEPSSDPGPLARPASETTLAGRPIAF